MLINKKEDVKDPYFKDMDTGWAWVVLFGSFVTFCLCGATQFASGIVHIILLEKYKASLSVTSVAGAIHLSLISVGGLYCLTDYYFNTKPSTRKLSNLFLEQISTEQFVLSFLLEK